MIRIRPDLAVLGTVATNPAGSLRRSLAVSGLRTPPPAARAVPRNSTTIPFWRLRPLKRSRPPGATMRGLVPHTSTGQQRTDVITGLAGLRRACAVAGTAAASAASSADMTRSDRNPWPLITEPTPLGCVFVPLKAVFHAPDWRGGD